MPKLNVDLVVDDQGSVVIKKFAGTVKDVFSALGPALLALGGGAGVAEILGQSVKSASDLAEVTSKFNTVFTGQTALAETWAQTMVDGYAMSTREARQYLAAMQDLLVPMGMGAKEAGAMSNQVVKLAADLGSFNNKETSQVMDDIQSALVGNYETMKKYGVVLNASVVEQEALRLGLKKTKEELTAADKAQAAYSLIVKGSQAAIGDMARTQDGYANQLKRAKSTVEDITAAIGGDMQEALAEMLKWFNDSSPEIIDTVKGIADGMGLVISFTKGVVTELWNIEEYMSPLFALDKLMREWTGGSILTLDFFGPMIREQKAAMLAYQQTEDIRKRIDETQTMREKTAADAAIVAEQKRSAEILKIRAGLNAEIEKLTTSEVEQKRAALDRELADAWMNYGQESALWALKNQEHLLKELLLDRELAELDKKALVSRLDEYKKYYADVAKQIEDNYALQKKALKDISDLHAQAMNTRRGTEGMLTDLGGAPRSADDQYKTTRGELSQLFKDAQFLTGQERITALDTFKQKVHDLAVEFKEGAGGYSGKSIFAVASDDIRAAYDLQKQTIDNLTAAAQQQATNSQIWGVELYNAAIQANNGIVYLQDTLDALDEQLRLMDKVVKISAPTDTVAAQVAAIKKALDDLHDKVITITTKHIDTYGAQNSLQTLVGGVLGSHALGTGFIPRTGPYELHYGESVNTAAETRALSAGGGSFRMAAGGGATFGDIVINIPANAAPLRPEDYRRITRDIIIPELRQAGYGR